MKTIEPENRKYFNKFGTTRQASVDWKQESAKPLARCSVCVEMYDGGYKTDKLVLEMRHNRWYLCCEAHRRKQYAE